MSDDIQYFIFVKKRQQEFTRIYLLLELKIIMGCGCLAPKAIQGDLTIHLIDEIHIKLPSSSRESPYLISSNNYQKVKQKIYKKPSLRKLIDHLSSHRHKITEALSHNFKICHQGDTEETWMIGLTVLERIVDMAENQNGSRKTEKIQNILKDKTQNEGSQSEERQTELKTLKTIGEKQRLKKGHKSQTPSSDFIRQQILSSKFELLVFGIVHSCLRDENLYGQSLRILNTYARLGNTKFQAEEKIVQILKILLDNARQGFQTSITIQTYLTLISKMKQKSVLPLINNLIFFIKLWLQSKLTLNSSKSLKLITKTQNQVNLIELVISRFLTCSLNGMDYKITILILMELHDQQKFQVLPEFQQFYINVLRNNDLGSHFLKRLFLQFLYYGVLGSVQSLAGREQQLALIIGSINIEAKYRNQCDRQSKKCLFSLIKRWLITKCYIGLEEIIKYHCDLFLYCFAINIHLQRLQPFSQTQEIFKDIIHFITEQQKMVLIQTIFQEYQKEQTPPYLRKLLLNMSKAITSPIISILLQNNISRFSIDVSHLSIEQTLQFYFAVMSLYAKFEEQTVMLYLHPICELLMSICAVLEGQETESKVKLIREVVGFCETIISAEQMIVAFYHKIEKIIDRRIIKSQPFGSFSKLKQGLISLFERFYIQSYLASYQPSQNFPADTTTNLKNYNDYFNDLMSCQIPSRIGLRQSSFDKGVSSIIRDSMQIRDQEESFRDVMQMIKP